MDNVKLEILKFIKENFVFGEMEIDEDQSLLDSGILDSTSILDLITFLEEKFEISINDEEIVPENLDSIQNISNFVEKKKTATIKNA